MASPLATFTILLIFHCWIPFSDQHCAMERGANTWCGCGQGKATLGPCIGGDCPDGYTCVCDYCCEGCFDDCYDCALFAQYCENLNYCDLRQKCKKTCGLCVDAPPPDPNNPNPG